MIDIYARDLNSAAALSLSENIFKMLNANLLLSKLNSLTIFLIFKKYAYKPQTGMK